MKAKIWKKLNPLVDQGDLKGAIHLMKEEVARCDDSFEACFLARDLAGLYLDFGDRERAIHYAFLAGESFVREGEMFQAIVMDHWLREISEKADKAVGSEAIEKSNLLKTMVSETFSITRAKRKEADRDVAIPTPFQEFSASISLESEPTEEIPRHQLQQNLQMNFALFSSLRSVETEGLIEISELKRLKTGGRLYREGDASNGFYVVVNGELLLSSKSGKKKTFAAGDFVGDVGFFLGRRRTESLTAAGDVEVLEFAGNRLPAVFDEFPNLQEKLWRFFERRLFVDSAQTEKPFQGLSREELYAVFDFLTSINVTPGRILQREDRTVDRFGFLAQGQVLVKNRSGEKEVLDPPAFFGVEDFLSGGEATQQIEAKTDVYFLECSRGTFTKLCEMIPKLKK